MILYIIDNAVESLDKGGLEEIISLIYLLQDLVLAENEENIENKYEERIANIVRSN